MEYVQIIHYQNLIISVYVGHIAEIMQYLLGWSTSAQVEGVIYGDLIEFQLRNSCIPIRSQSS